MIQSQQRRRRARRGVAAVEFAIAMGILWVLIVGMLEVSRAILVKQKLTNAARQAVRTAVLPGAGWSDVANGTAGSDLYDIMVTDNGFTWSDISKTIVVTDTSGNSTTLTTADAGNVLQNSKWGYKISVKVSIPASKTTWGPGTIFITNATVESEYLVMMRQGNY